MILCNPLYTGIVPLCVINKMLISCLYYGNILHLKHKKTGQKLENFYRTCFIFCITMQQRYKKHNYNKYFKRMPRTYLPLELTSQLTYSSQTLLLYIIANTKTSNDNENNNPLEYYTYKEDKNIDFIKSQSICLLWKDLVDKKVLSKNKFYQGLKELIELDLIASRPYLDKNVYLINYYYINNMSDQQWHRFVKQMKSLSQNEAVPGFIKNFKSDTINNLVVADRLFKK